MTTGPFHRGRDLFGEAGREVIAPLSRMPEIARAFNRDRRGGDGGVSISIGNIGSAGILDMGVEEQARWLENLLGNAVRTSGGLRRMLADVTRSTP